jgi:hypothetical protein
MSGKLYSCYIAQFKTFFMKQKETLNILLGNTIIIVCQNDLKFLKNAIEV